ncbi:retroviral-like aspartic protease family protein [Alkalinema pantanalense CENA528]|uniref:retropepsin-like aspartic protease family protein n=1 Tax=Alkalinema pantanalense TaxID=1620705 RepID=UPI003D6F4280
MRWGFAATIGLLCASCQAPTFTPQASRPSPTASVTPTVPAKPSPQPPTAYGSKALRQSSAKPTVKLVSSPVFQMALDKAESADSISQSAQSPEDWNLVIDRWKSAIQLLKQTPKGDPNYKEVDRRLAIFQAGLSRAEQKLARSQGRNTSERYVAVDPRISDDGEPVSLAPAGNRVYRVAIKYYQGGIPVVDVLFNGKYRFEMMVDTGASGTMITQDMAQSLGVESIGSVPAMTPAGTTQFSVGYLKSMAVGGGTIYDFPVAIGPVALLGHDFFGDCDISIKRNQNLVEFSRCSN